MSNGEANDPMEFGTTHKARGKILGIANRTAIVEFTASPDNAASHYKKGSTMILDGRCFPTGASHGDEGTLEYRSGHWGGAWFFTKDGG